MSASVTMYLNFLKSGLLDMTCIMEFGQYVFPVPGARKSVMSHICVKSYDCVAGHI